MLQLVFAICALVLIVERYQGVDRIRLGLNAIFSTASFFICIYSIFRPEIFNLQLGINSFFITALFGMSGVCFLSLLIQNSRLSPSFLIMITSFFYFLFSFDSIIPLYILLSMILLFRSSLYITAKSYSQKLVMNTVLLDLLSFVFLSMFTTFFIISTNSFNIFDFQVVGRTTFIISLINLVLASLVVLRLPPFHTGILNLYRVNSHIVSLESLIVRPFLGLFFFRVVSNILREIDPEYFALIQDSLFIVMAASLFFNFVIFNWKKSIESFLFNSFSQNVLLLYMLLIVGSNDLQNDSLFFIIPMGSLLLFIGWNSYIGYTASDEYQNKGSERLGFVFLFYASFALQLFLPFCFDVTRSYISELSIEKLFVFSIAVAINKAAIISKTNLSARSEMPARVKS